MRSGNLRFLRPATSLEWVARQVYWRGWRWIDPLRSRMRQGNAPLPCVTTTELSAALRQHLPADRGPYLIHSSVGNFTLTDDQGHEISHLSAAAWVLSQLKQVVGPNGTLCMPTHPRYSDNPGFMYDKSALKLIYDVRRTPSGTGLLTELFRRQPGCLRSWHPLSSMAVQGPQADMLLEQNVNDQRPLPHGIWSSYYRLCLHGGTVVGLGVPLIKAMTILHVAEEVRDEDWPVPAFFYDRQFTVIDPRGGHHEVIVRERRPEFVRSLILSQVRRDLLREGLLQEYAVQGVPLAVADARGVMEFMQEQQRQSSYPYLLARVASWGKPRYAPSTHRTENIGAGHENG